MSSSSSPAIAKEAAKRPATIKVLSIDDHPLIREGITVVIDSQSDMSMVGTASTGKEGIKRFRALEVRAPPR